jgi:phosphatidylglycerophosphatase C
VTQPQPHKPVVAAFDFDGTLTRHDSLFPFLLHIAGPVKLFNKIILLSPILAAYAVGLLRNDSAKEKVLRSFLAGMEMDTLQHQALQFATYKLPALQRTVAMQRFHWHKQQGHRCVVVSASLEIYLRPWANKAGFDDILGTRLALLDNTHTSGKLQGENCYGAEKMRRLETLLGPRDGYTLYAYGDSRGDKALLSAADFPFYKKFTDVEILNSKVSNPP